MEILLPEQNYSLDELNTTLYTAVKGYIENIRLLKVAHSSALSYNEGHRIILPLPTYNQFKFDWTWNKDYYNPRKTIKTGDDLTLQVGIKLKHYIEGLSGTFRIQVNIAATKVRKSKKNNELGYIFKAITMIFSTAMFVAKVEEQSGVYITNFLLWTISDQSESYSYEDTQVQQASSRTENNTSFFVLYVPKGQIKAISVSEDVKLNIPRGTPTTLIPIDSISPAFKSFVQKMKRS